MCAAAAAIFANREADDEGGTATTASMADGCWEFEIFEFVTAAEYDDEVDGALASRLIVIIILVRDEEAAKK